MRGCAVEGEECRCELWPLCSLGCALLAALMCRPLLSVRRAVVAPLLLLLLPFYFFFVPSVSRAVRVPTLARNIATKPNNPLAAEHVVFPKSACTWTGSGSAAQRAD